MEKQMRKSIYEAILSKFENNLLTVKDIDQIEKSWSKDLQSKFPNGKWVTIRGARVFVNDGKVVAGLDGFNRELDKFFESGKDEAKENKKILYTAAFEELLKHGHKDPTNKMIEKEAKKLESKKETGEITSADKQYFNENKKEILAIIDDDPFISIRDAIKEHKEQVNKVTVKTDIKAKTLSDLIKEGGEKGVRSVEVKFKPDPISGKNKVETFDIVDEGVNIIKLIGSEQVEEVNWGKPVGSNVTLDTFKDLAKKSKDVKDFVSKIRGINNVPASVSEEFFKKYGADGSLSPQKAAEAMFNEVNGITVKKHLILEDMDGLSKSSKQEYFESLQALEGDIEKARITKYYRREGSPGDYKYYYTKEEYEKVKNGGKVTPVNKKKQGYDADLEKLAKPVTTETSIEEFLDEDTGEVIKIKVNKPIYSLKFKAALEAKQAILTEKVNQLTSMRNAAYEKQMDLYWEWKEKKNNLNQLTSQLKDLFIDMEEEVGAIIDKPESDALASEYADRIGDLQGNIEKLSNEVIAANKVYQKAEDEFEKIHPEYAAALDEYDDVNYKLKNYTFGKREYNKVKYPETYHKSYSGAVQSAAEYARSMGYEIDEDDWWREISTGPGKPSDGKYVRHSIALTKDGKEQKKNLQIVVYGMNNGYELTTYIL